MAMARKPILKPSAFLGLERQDQLREIHTALSETPSGKINAKIIEKEGHVFVPAGEQNRKSLKSAIGYHGADSHEQAIGRAVSDYITGKMNGDLVQVTSHVHNGVQGFKVIAKKTNGLLRK
ncbi:MAG: hypothetical protein WCX64_06640 [Candidatus Micrarchaeia archaeon]|jgi:hypothetical protein